MPAGTSGVVFVRSFSIVTTPLIVAIDPSLGVADNIGIAASSYLLRGGTYFVIDPPSPVGLGIVIAVGAAGWPKSYVAVALMYPFFENVAVPEPMVTRSNTTLPEASV